MKRAQYKLHVSVLPKDRPQNGDGTCPVASAITESFDEMGMGDVFAECASRGPVFWLRRGDRSAEPTKETEAGPFEMPPRLADVWRKGVSLDRIESAIEIPGRLVEAWPEFGTWHEEETRESETKMLAVRERDLRMRMFRNVAHPRREPGPHTIAFARWLAGLWRTNRAHGADLAEALASSADAHSLLMGAELAGWIRVWSYSPRKQQKALLQPVTSEHNEACIWEVACEGELPARCSCVYDFLSAMSPHVGGALDPECIECGWARAADKAGKKESEHAA